MYEDLDKLHKLKENGIITENEYESEKKRLLQNRNSIEQNQTTIMFLLRVIGTVLGFIIMCWGMRIWNGYNHNHNNICFMLNYNT